MVLATTAVDVCVIGEGEISGVEILQSWDHLEKVKGIAFKVNGNILFNAAQDRFVDLDAIPLPDFSLFDMERSLLILPIGPTMKYIPASMPLKRSCTKTITIRISNGKHSFFS